jgi:uncharacterized protein (TIRG00374 family)
MGASDLADANREDAGLGAAGGRATGAWIAAGILLAAFFLYLSLRGIDWHQVGRTIAAAEWSRLAVASALGVLALFMRALRWRLLLTAGGPVDVASAFWATAAGYFGNNFLPARAGELVRTVMISARTTLDAPFVLATALSERVADAIALVIITGAVLLVVPAPPGWMAGAARTFGTIGVAAAAVLALLPLLEAPVRAAIARAPLPHALQPRLLAAIEQGLRGMRGFHSMPRLAGFLALTVAIWCVDAFGTVLAAAALGFEMPLAVAFLLIAALGVATALPSTPGYVGIYQFVAVTVLTPFGFTRSDALAFILVVQALSFAVIGCWGTIGLVRYRRARRSA